eukprot:gb/GEZN01013150.1/.p1 GENE.gb/GEZN01013150.1/~~gb/GEZN01013150.1/.p1  ORF type:complete len:306 (-),score=59.51 gb/GEZN01013150.1/:115-915(-)
MAGGYNPRADQIYRSVFQQWHLIDEFCYFGHHRVCIPPAVWIQDAHAHGKLCLGTLITEHAVGAADNSLLLDQAASAAQKLGQMLAYYGFDGWLVNIESPLRGGAADIARLVKFLTVLRQQCRSSAGHTARVLVYDSLDKQGQIKYANQLSSENKALFDASDGMFLNYWWTAEQLRSSRELAGPERRADVYAGVDVWGRNTTCYGAGPLCAQGVKLVAQAGISVALFAPGWCLEVGPARDKAVEDAAKQDAAFWQQLVVPAVQAAL